MRRGDRDAAEATIAEIVRWRREHQPGGQNCGSVFVNPVPGEVSAGSLVDGLGLRGFRIGTAWVSQKHANFVQASEGGSAADVRAVIEAVRAARGRGDGLPAAQRGAPRRVRRGGRRDAAADHPGRPPLPGADIPSAEVLDELLRAFSVDVTDHQRLEQVDLSSPEVAELLTPAEGADAPDVTSAPAESRTST